MLDKLLIDPKKVKEEDKEKADYDYLLGMKIYSLTQERVEELLAEMKELFLV